MSTGAVDVSVRAIAVDGSDVYYVLSETSTPPSNGGNVILLQEGGVVIRVPAAGGQPLQVAGGSMFEAPAFTSTSAILEEGNVVDGGISGGAIISIPRDGSPASTLVVLGDNDSSAVFGGPPPVTDGTFVYYVSGNGVEAISVDPAAAGAQPTLISQSFPDGMSVVGQHLLLITQGDLESISLPASAGSSPIPLASGLYGLYGGSYVIPCGAYACWLDPVSSSLGEIDPAGGCATTIADVSKHFAQAGGVAFDGATFFVSGSEYSSLSGTARIADKGAIVRIPQQGGLPVDVVVSARGANVGPSFAVDDECLYYSTPTGIYSVYKAAENAVTP